MDETWCCAPKETRGCDVCKIGLDGFRCAMKKRCHDFYCKDSKTGLISLINQEMEKKYEHQLGSGISPDTFNYTNENNWDPWDYAEIGLALLFCGILVFFFCFCYVRCSGHWRKTRQGGVREMFEMRTP